MEKISDEDMLYARVYAAAITLANALHEDAVAHKDTDLQAALVQISSERFMNIAKQIVEIIDAVSGQK